MRGAWIEIKTIVNVQVNLACRSPCGERGLKYAVSHSRKLLPASLPCGERGLKYAHGNYWCRGIDVAPHAGAWIEILTNANSYDFALVAPHAGSVD